MSDQNKLLNELTIEEIESYGTLNPEDEIPFTYPEGVCKVINSLDAPMDTATKRAMFQGLQTLIVFM